MLYDILMDDIAYWEECSAVDLKASFPKEYASLVKALHEFRAGHPLVEPSISRISRFVRKSLKDD